MIMHVISIYIFLSVITTAYLAAFIQSRGTVFYIKISFFLSLAIDIYLYGYLSELNAGYVKQLLFWNQFQYFGIPFVSALWLTLALMYTGHFFPVSKWKIAFIFVIPIITFILRFTNDFHHLYFKSLDVKYIGNRLLIIKGYGPWYYIQISHSMIMILISFALYIFAFLKRKQSDGQKIYYMIGASVFACLGLILNAIQLGDLNLDYTVLLLPISVILVLIAIMRHDFLEIRTLARKIIYEQSKEGMLILNNKMLVVDYNKEAKHFFAEQGIKLKKDNINIMLEGNKQLADIFKSSEQGFWMKKDADDVKYYDIISTDIFHSKSGLCGKLKTIRDVTERQMLYERLKNQAAIDELSGLLNRREFINMSQRKFKRYNFHSSKLYLLMMDIDYFKTINDTYGHMSGDYTIKKIGELLIESFRKSDLIGRLGGEEFAVLILSGSQEKAYEKAEQFRRKLEQYRVLYDNNIFQMTVSIGIAKTETETDDIDDLMKKADKALYVSKNSGRNRTTLFSEDLNNN